MPKNNAPYQREANQDSNNASRGGAVRTPGGPFDYSIDEEAERAKAMKRVDDGVPNDPSRPIL